MEREVAIGTTVVPILLAIRTTVVPIILAIRTTVVLIIFVIRTTVVPIIFAIHTKVDRTMYGRKETSNWYLQSILKLGYKFSLSCE